MAAEDLAAVAAEEAGLAAADPAEDSAEEDRRWEDGDRRAARDSSGDLDGASVRDIAAAVFPLSWYL